MDVALRKAQEDCTESYLLTVVLKLERELNAANSKIELLMSANADVARIADERDAAENRIRLLIAERDTARRQADQQYKLREEFRDLLGTDDVEQGVAMVRGLQERIKRLEEAGNNLLWNFCPEYTSDLTQEQSDALKQWNKARGEAKP
jgi:polyhydroxyalkanoate synthesis regulator protein